MVANVVDSSGWLEFLLGGEGAGDYRSAIVDTANLIVPTISIFEVTRLLLRTRPEEDARAALSYMQAGRIEPLDLQLASEAAILAVAHRLPMADSIIYATAQRFGATLWTQDADFEGLAGVRYFSKASPVKP